MTLIAVLQRDAERHWQVSIWSDTMKSTPHTALQEGDFTNDFI